MGVNTLLPTAAPPGWVAPLHPTPDPPQAFWLPGLWLCAHHLQLPFYDFFNQAEWERSFPGRSCCEWGTEDLQWWALETPLCGRRGLLGSNLRGREKLLSSCSGVLHTVSCSVICRHGQQPWGRCPAPPFPLIPKAATAGALVTVKPLYVLFGFSHLLCWPQISLFLMDSLQSVFY